MLDEYALRFYALLEQSLKLDAMDWKEAAMASSYPYMEESARQEIMDNYDKQGRDFLEDIREAYSADHNKITEMFNE